MDKNQLLSVEEIEALAEERMRHAPNKEVIGRALRRGQIEGAIKVSTDKSGRPLTTASGGRWRAPLWAVLVYLANYKPREKESDRDV